MPFGVSSTGFIAKTIGDIVSALNSAYRVVYGLGVNVDPSSRIGQKIGIYAGTLAEVWELGEAIFNAGDPDAATGAGLDNQLKLVGLTRKAAVASTAVLTLTGTAGSVIALGKRAEVIGTSNKFALDAGAVIAALSAWTVTTGYSVGQRVTNAGNAYQCITAGTSAGAGGPTTAAADITDGTVHWRFLGAGAGAVDAAATCTATGPVQGFSGSITVIDTPVAGWAGVINVLDAAVGRNQETDFEARARRALSFQKAALTPLGSIRAAILEVPGVTSCVIFENVSDATVDSIPPHAFEALVEGGDDTAIQAAIFANGPGGIQSYGTTSGTQFDSSGNAHTIAFSRPTDVDIWVIATLTYDPSAYPEDGDTQVKDQIVLDGDARQVGKDVVASQIAAGVFAQGVGVFDVSSVKIGTAPSPTLSTTIVMTPRQKAAFDTTRVTIISSAGSF
jgi:uncharacterized phage protein gp47/JayE